MNNRPGPTLTVAPCNTVLRAHLPAVTVTLLVAGLYDQRDIPGGPGGGGGEEQQRADGWLVARYAPEDPPFTPITPASRQALPPGGMSASITRTAAGAAFSQSSAFPHFLFTVV